MNNSLTLSACVLGGAGVLILSYCLIYIFVIRTRTATWFTPQRVSSAILAAALVILAVGGLLVLRENALSYKFSYHPNRVRIRNFEDNYGAIYARYADSESIPGHTKSRIECDGIRFTCWFSDYPEEQILPGFVIFAEYTGRADPSAVTWGPVSVRWLQNSTEKTYFMTSGDIISDKLMLIGHYETNVDSLSINAVCTIHQNGKKYVQAITDIPICAKHYAQLKPVLQTENEKKAE